MKLEVGKTYSTRNGGTVTMVRCEAYHDLDPMPFKGDNEAWYTEDGRSLGTGGQVLPWSVDWTAPADPAPANPAPANPAPAFSPTQVSRLLDALNLARNGCSDQSWEDALVALEEALCPEEGKEGQ